MLAKYLWETGSVIITVMGSLHMYYTFFTDKFSSKNPKVVEEMKASFPILTKEMTIWKAWISFNATHSSGAMFIGIINFYLALNHFEVLRSDHFFFLFGIITLGFYVWLAKKYWFRTVFMGAVTAFACFVVSYLLTVMMGDW